MNTETLQRINKYGRKRLACEVGIAPAAITKWLRPGGRIPAERVLTVERITGIRREILRPDIYPATDAQRDNKEMHKENHPLA